MKALKFTLSLLLLVLLAMVLYGLSPIRPVREVFTFTTIDAPQQQVWQVLTDFNVYPQWNPFFTAIEGRCADGERIRVQVQMEDRVIHYEPRISHLSAPGEMAWDEQLILPGIFDGHHRFLLETRESGQTRFVQHDTYTGSLAPLLLNFYQLQAEAGFRRMNDALKHRAEQAQAPATSPEIPPAATESSSTR